MPPAAESPPRGFFDHESPEGTDADARISAAGYDWSQWAENLASRTADPGAVITSWMDGGIHQENMLGCSYRDAGAAAVPSGDGLLWVLVLARPA